MPGPTVRRTALALAALFALQLGAALASAAPCAVACCPGMAAAGDAAPAPCRSLSPASCCSASTSAPAPEASAPPVAAPSHPACVPAPGLAAGSAALHLDVRAPRAAALRSVVLRL